MPPMAVVPSSWGSAIEFFINRVQADSEQTFVLLRALFPPFLRIILDLSHPLLLSISFTLCPSLSLVSPKTYKTFFSTPRTFSSFNFHVLYRIAHFPVFTVCLSLVNGYGYNDEKVK